VDVVLEARGQKLIGIEEERCSSDLWKSTGPKMDQTMIASYPFLGAKTVIFKYM
jgi:hypothetical protein